MAPTTVDGLDIDDATIDGTEVSEITVDGNVVFKAGPDIPDSATYSWPTNDGSGSTLTEEVVGYDGDIIGATWYQNGGVDGYSLEFDGTDDYVEIPWNTTLAGADGLSLSIWVYPYSEMDGNENIFSATDEGGSGNPNDWNLFVHDDGEIRFSTDDTSGALGNGEGLHPNTDEWTQIGVSLESDGDATLYFDGDVVDTTSFSTMPKEANEGEVTIGGNEDGGRVWDGRLAFATFWEDPLSDSEMQSHYDEYDSLFD